MDIQQALYAVISFTERNKDPNPFNLKEIIELREYLDSSKNIMNKYGENKYSPYSYEGYGEPHDSGIVNFTYDDSSGRYLTIYWKNNNDGSLEVMNIKQNKIAGWSDVFNDIKKVFK